jgi:hypothetical protein
MIIKLFLARESSVSDIPVGDGKNDNLFYSVEYDIVDCNGRVPILLAFVLIGSNSL